MLRKAIADIQAKYVRKDIPELRPGDTRPRPHEDQGRRQGAHPGLRGRGHRLPARATPGRSMFTVRKVSYGVGVERMFPRPQPAHRQDRGGGPRRGPPLAPLLPARAAGEGRPPPPGGGAGRERRRAGRAPAPATPPAGLARRESRRMRRVRAASPRARRASRVRGPGGNIAPRRDPPRVRSAGRPWRGAGRRPRHAPPRLQRRRRATAPRCGACSRRSSTRTRATPRRCPRAAGGPANAPMRAGLTLVGNDRDHLPARPRLRRGLPAPSLRRGEARVRARLAGARRDPRRSCSSTVGVPAARRASSALLALSAADLPSRQGAGARRRAAPARAALTPEQARQRIAAARGGARAGARRGGAAGAAGRAAGAALQARGGAAGAATKLREGLERALAARAELDGGGCRGGGARRRRGEARRLRAGERASATRRWRGRPRSAQALDAADAPGRAGAVLAGRRFLGGRGRGLALAVAGAVAAARRSELRYVALLAVPAFG